MDVLKVWLYATASAALGAWMAPFIYSAGMALREVTAGRKTNGLFEWLAEICWTADFPDFFAFSVLFAAAILFLPAIHWLGGGRLGERRLTRTLRLPEGAYRKELGQRLLPNRRGLRQCVFGFLLVTSLFLLIAGVLILAGVLEWKSPDEQLRAWLLRGIFIALLVAMFQELMFRGIVLGIFLRAMRPSAALGLSAVFFAFAHFLNPPPGLTVADPDAAGVGFELLGKILALFSDPRSVFGTFAPLLALGFVLAYARWRTASLFLPIGLHTGWIFVSRLLGQVTQPAPSPDSFMWVLSGLALHQGLLPVAGIVLAGVLANFLTTAANDADPRET